jgi:Prenyltransferase and squalene oxidase repeat
VSHGTAVWLIATVAVVTAAVALASPATFLQAHQSPDGGFSETGGVASPGLTAWAALALVAGGDDPGRAADYLRAHEGDPMPAPTRALVALAEAALSDPEPALALPVTPGQTNTVTWTILARRQAGGPAPPPLVRLLLTRQAPSGGWGWAGAVAPDSNDTAAAVQALRAAEVGGKPIRKALDFLRRLRNPDGGFALVRGRMSDAQSTAWAVQAFLAAGSTPPSGAYAYLRGLRRSDGSYRYSRRYGVTPVWVTAQVVPAVARTAFPLERGPSAP